MVSQNEIALRDEIISYTYRTSSRARRLRLAVHRDGSIVITAPTHYNQNVAEQFMQQKAQWLISKRKFFSTLPPVSDVAAAHHGKRDYIKYKEQARALIVEKVRKLNENFGYHYNKISIKNQKRCWGSCSKKRNLNFNYKLLFLPKRAQGYIIVHELAHLKEFNHSKKFWDLVARVIPDYKIIRKELRSSI